MITDDMKGARVLSHDGFSEKLGTIVEIVRDRWGVHARVQRDNGEIVQVPGFVREISGFRLTGPAREIGHYLIKGSALRVVGT